MNLFRDVRRGDLQHRTFSPARDLRSDLGTPFTLLLRDYSSHFFDQTGEHEVKTANSQLFIADSEQIVQTRLMFKFEKLDVWQKAIDFANLAYSKTKTFPSDERFGLTNQMHRAAVSVSSNIAESSARISDADFARFVEIATGSLFEVVSEATMGKRQGYLGDGDFVCHLQSSRGARSDAERLASVARLQG